MDPTHDASVPLGKCATPYRQTINTQSILGNVTVHLHSYAPSAPRSVGALENGSENCLSYSPVAAARPDVLAGTLVGTSRVAPVHLVPLLAAAGRAGIVSDALFHGLGLTVEDLSVPGFTLSFIEANTVVRRALRLLKVPDLGLRLGMKTRITERGAMALGLMAATTLGDAIALALKFPGSAGYLMAVHAERTAHLHLEIAEPMFGSDDIAPFLVDIMFAGSVRMRRQVTEAHYAPASVELVRSRPANAADYEKHFACPLRFGSKRNVLASELTWLAYPLPMANAMAYNLSRKLLEQDTERSRTSSALGLAVERAIRRALPVASTPAGLARSLNLSERGLRRKLAQEGLSFRDLLDEARKSRGLDLVAAARLSLTEIALETGFSDVRAFSRAFKRWTGSSPSKLRIGTQTPVGDISDGGH